MTEWRETTLEELASPESHALATGPFGSAISAKHFVEEGTPVLRGSNLSLDIGIRLRDEGLAFLDEIKAASFKRSIARRGDLVFTCWGTIGQVGLVDHRSYYDEYVVSNKQMKLTPDPLKADSLFLYYLLSSRERVGEVQSQSIGAAVPGFNLGQLRALRVTVPPVALQRRIAGLLGSLDDLIENSRRRIDVLKEIVQTIYREWFVRFRYPGHEQGTFVDSPLGPIPERWIVKSIGDVLELRYGKALKANDRAGGPVAVVGSSGVVGWHDEELIPAPAIVVGRKGNVGNLVWMNSPSWPIDTTYYVVTGLPLRYVFEQLARANFINAHAAVPGLSRAQAYTLPFLQPDESLMKSFATVAGELGAQAEGAAAQAAKLASLRDHLLPKLVTGQIDVSHLDFDDVVGSVA